MTWECRFVNLRIKSGILNHMMKRLTYSFFHCITTVLVCILLSSSLQAQEIPTDPAIVSAGAALFNGNCKTCHRVKTKLIGPALAGVETRVPSIKWIYDWVSFDSYYTPRIFCWHIHHRWQLPWLGF